MIDLQYLWDSWVDVADKLAKARHVSVFCDYDGTLTPIAPKPELAELSTEVRTLLKALAEKPHFTVAIVSGRSLKDIKDKVRVAGLVYAGNHGLEVDGVGLEFTHPVALKARPIIQGLYRSLSEALEAIEGVVMENKGLTLSVHYRLVEPSEVSRVDGVIASVVGPLEQQGKMRLTPGKKVFEVRPVVQWDKGRTTAFILDRIPGRDPSGPRLSLFLGDDRTDEDGFSEVRNRGGITILVGEKNEESRAQFWLKSSAEVEELLRRLLSLG